MEQDTRQYLAENRVVFADVAAAVENRGFARVDAAPSTPWDAPGAEDAFWDDARGTARYRRRPDARELRPEAQYDCTTPETASSPAKEAPNDS